MNANMMEYLESMEIVDTQANPDAVDQESAEKEEVYVPTGFITEADRFVFGKGTHYEIYKKLGAHPASFHGEDGVYFAVWVPSAKNVSVVGDFNGWMGFNHNMHLLGTSGIYELFIPGLKEGELYKYAIVPQQGEVLFKADPYANGSEFRPGTASVVRDITGYEWHDKDWQEEKKKSAGKDKPMAIYEVHIGSWKRGAISDRDITDKPLLPNESGFLNYREIVHDLAAYVKDMGYTHVELMGIAEHPFDGSWGYQVTGYYSPTSRYGLPKDFMHFVDHMHQNGIGVILDWVPAHFPRDAFGLSTFDGSCVYEYADSRKGEHPDWGTKVFDYAKYEVSNFLIANAMYWVEQYHVDGLRVDAVASMLYLDYGRSHGNWVPNKYGGHENLEAIEFFKHLNSIMAYRNPGAMVIAEESTAWPKVTHSPNEDGLGFTLKWNMGWMHDFIDYVKQDPLYRKFSHSQMTFSMTYAFSENYILVLSHDEVVHLKCSMLEKMPGYPHDKIENLKTAYTFMFGHPGKKLLFMGQEFGQIREWSEERSIDWYLLQEPGHQDIQNHMRKLLHLYTEHPAMYECDRSWDGFEWVNCNDGERSTFSYIRKGSSTKKYLLFVFNFTPLVRDDYHVGAPSEGEYRVVLDSRGSLEGSILLTEEGECDNHEYMLTFDLAPLSAVVFEFTMRESQGKKKEIKDDRNLVIQQVEISAELAAAAMEVQIDEDMISESPIKVSVIEQKQESKKTSGKNRHAKKKRK